MSAFILRYLARAGAVALFAVAIPLFLALGVAQVLTALLAAGFAATASGVQRCAHVAARPHPSCRAPRHIDLEDIARRVVVLGIFVLVPVAAFAQTGAAPVSVDLMPLLNALVGIAAALVLGLVPLIIARLKTAGVLKNTAMATALQNAATSAAQYGINAVQADLAGKTVTVDLKNQVVAQATQYLVQHVPDAIAHFGKSDADIAQMILARLDLTAGTVTLSGQPAAQQAPAVTLASVR